MGQRSIDTVLRVQHEGEYKAALKNCNSELRVLKTELDKVTSDFRTNANSMEALTAKGQTLTKMYEAQKQKVDLLQGALQKSKESRDAEAETLEKLQAQYETARKALKDYADQNGENSEEYQKQKQAVEGLRDAIIQHQAKLDSASRSVNGYEIQLNRASVELNHLTDQQEENNQLLEEAAQSSDHCAQSIDRYGDAVRDSAEDTGDAVSAVDALSAALVAGGIQQKVEDVAAAMMECSHASQEYEVALAKVSTIADSSVMSQQELHDSTLALSTELRRDVDEVTAAAYDALSAGVQTADVLDFTRQSAMLATAGFTDLSTSVDVLTTVENAYQMSAAETERVSSVLVKTQDLGKTTVDELGKVMGRVIPSAAAYHVSLENIATGYAIMTAAGVNAENTTTYMSTMLDELADSGSQVSAILQERTGKTFADLMASGQSLGDVLQVLGDSVDGDNVAFANLWSSATAGKAAISLFDGSAQKFNTTLDQMEHSSGAVAKNYEIMANASQQSSKRVEVAAKNLKIAVGDQLNPALDKVRNSGAGLLEEATRIVSQSPALVATVAGVTSALGFLAAGVSALMVAKAAAAAMAALNVTLLANPAVLITTAVVGLSAAIAAYAANVETTTDKVNALTESSRGLSDAIESSSAGYEDTMVSAEAAGRTVDHYVDRLTALERQSSRSQAEQLEYSMILDKIRDLMPGINLEIDEQTGLLRHGAQAIRSDTTAWMENAKKQAVIKRYQEQIEALADAEFEQATNEAKLSMVQQDMAEKQNQLTKAKEELAVALERENELTKSGLNYLGDTSPALDEAKEHTAALYAEINTLTGELQPLQEEEALLTEAIRTGNDAMSQSTAEVEAAQLAYENYTGSAVESSEVVGEAGFQVSDDLSAASQISQQAYEDMRSKARESLETQIGLFEDLSGQSDLTTQDMIQRLSEQGDEFYNYADNIQLAMERGVDTGLVQKLSDGSAESMHILAELVTGSDDQIEALNFAFERTGRAKDTVARSMADVQAEFATSMGNITWQMEDDAWYAGRNTVWGLCDGVYAAEADYCNAMADLAYSGQAAYARANEINSPSKRYQRLAEYDVAGLTKTYQEAIPRMQSQTKALADAGYLASIQARRQQLPALASRTQALPHDSQEPVLTLLQRLLTAVEAGQSITLDSRALIGATASGYDRALGRNRILADRGAL